jgi:hypothetical protein
VWLDSIINAKYFKREVYMKYTTSICGKTVHYDNAKVYYAFDGIPPVVKNGEGYFKITTIDDVVVSMQELTADVVDYVRDVKPKHFTLFNNACADGDGDIETFDGLGLNITQVMDMLLYSEREKDV